MQIFKKILCVLSLLSIVFLVPSDAYANDGSIILETASLEHDVRQGQYNSLVQVDSDTYALAYTGEDEDGFISTFTISSSGAITPIQIQNHANTSEEDDVANIEHEEERGMENSLVQVDSDTYALAYEGLDRDGFISTFTISSSGVITPIQKQNNTNT